ncbi:MAG: hypothetical protein ACI8Z7_000521 [Candidatus Nanohaloarchaea archaeon]|jgi:hypothetical protein
MSQKGSRSRAEIYEEDFQPVLEDLEEDPFRSLDLEDMVNYESSFIGRVLSYASKADEYDVERIRTGPSFYTLEESEEDDITQPAPREDKELFDVVLERLEESDYITDSDLEQIISKNLDSNSTTVKISKVGEIRSYLKEREKINYDPTESVFKLED